MDSGCILVAESNNLLMDMGREGKGGISERFWLLGLHSWAGQWCSDEKTTIGRLKEKEVAC